MEATSGEEVSRLNVQAAELFTVGVFVDVEAEEVDNLVLDIDQLKVGDLEHV